ncbi:MAG: HAMP domain-containing histidine kinase, partial [Candidatus Heimdallarchaeota archaeon]|nr:HAMP domain-containing histidine kinase [Candidatus Heimdallarchaeota archaeon]MCK5143912.1 HAMP domain-containing histidine kinase [Candidatus Heimdallarchaeota archaeon]
EERKCFLSITDYGKGISPEERKSILNRLEKKNVNKSISGLGLHIVKTLVERYKGRFWIKSRDIDDYSKGTIFKIGLFTG